MERVYASEKQPCRRKLWERFIWCAKPWAHKLILWANEHMFLLQWIVRGHDLKEKSVAEKWVVKRIQQWRPESFWTANTRGIERQYRVRNSHLAFNCHEGHRDNQVSSSRIADKHNPFVFYTKGCLCVEEHPTVGLPAVVDLRWESWLGCQPVVNAQDNWVRTC